MKLLFDENLAPGLADTLAQVFPGSSHVHRLGLGSADDALVWQYAREHGFTVVTRDSDFHERSLVLGYPPKVIWIRRSNCSTSEIEQLLLARTPDIEKLDSDTDAAFLILL